MIRDRSSVLTAYAVLLALWMVMLIYMIFGR